ncbi:MAG TPA: hypothetical protein VMV53_11100 [Acidimicrobiales bacterium]|nr:hypothetical protein [Acidimicrobiales bacterium]
MGVFVGAVIAVVLVLSLLTVVAYAVVAAALVVRARRRSRGARALDRELERFLNEVLAHHRTRLPGSRPLGR